jgi:transposase
LKERVMSQRGGNDPAKTKHNGRRYDKQFKIAAAKLVSEQGYTPKQAALSLGVHVNTLQYWVRVYGQQPQQQAETIDTLRVRVKELEKHNQQLVLEKEILKKATAFFAREQP